MKMKMILIPVPANTTSMDIDVYFGEEDCVSWTEFPDSWVDISEVHKTIEKVVGPGVLENFERMYIPKDVSEYPWAGHWIEHPWMS